MQEEIREKLKEKILEMTDLSREISDEELLFCIDRALGGEKLSVRERLRIRKEIFDSFRRLDVLQELMDDKDVTEIMVNGASDIFVEKAGRIYHHSQRFYEKEKLEDVIQRIVSSVNRRVNTSSPIVDARLPDGSRVNVVLPPIAPDGPILTIRKFSREVMSMEDLTEKGSITKGAAKFLMERVKNGSNIFISGGTGSGKTTFLNALSRAIPDGERVVTIEDSLELQLSSSNLVRLEARMAGYDGEGEISIRSLIRNAMRMRPDRLIVGEVRGPEALDMLQAMNTGHDGSLSTGHANSARDMLSRIETMVLMGGELPISAIRTQIASALDILVHLQRFHDGRRKVVSIYEVVGCEDEVKIKELYALEKGRLKKVGEFEGSKRRDRLSEL